MNRALFGTDGALNRQEAYELIDDADKGTVFFRLIVSPDPRREDSQRDLDLREITDQAMFALSMKLMRNVEYIAAIHDDHAPHRHVHVIALVPGRLDQRHLKLLRETATEASLFQRRERDLAQQAIRKLSRSVDRGRVARGVRASVPRSAGPVATPVRGPFQEPPFEAAPEVFVQAQPEGVPAAGSTATIRGSSPVSRSPRGRSPRVSTKPSICPVCGEKNCSLHHKDIQRDQEV
jgi:hypothetical protein